MVRTTTNAPVDIGDYPESSKPNRLVIESVKQGKTSHKEPQAHKKSRGSKTSHYTEGTTRLREL